MKKLLLTLVLPILVLGTVITIVLAQAFGTIDVSGSDSEYDGTYFEGGAGTYNGKPYWQYNGKGPQEIYWQIVSKSDPNGWWISDKAYGEDITVFYNTENSVLPPRDNWQLGALGVKYSYTAPTLSGEGSLSVTLSSFSAKVIAQDVVIKWVTESEVDNLGFILEKRSGGMDSHSTADWEEIASYQTHDALRGQGNTSQRTNYSYIDQNVQTGQTYGYRLSDVNTFGEIHVCDVIQITIEDAVIPDETRLEPAFPNPFNPETRISYQLSESGPVKIEVFDLLGRKVRTLVDEFQSAGSYNIYWHGQDETGRQAATGTYLIVLKTMDGVHTQKVMMMR